MTLVQRLVMLVIAALLPVLAAVTYGMTGLREAQEEVLRQEAQRIARMIGAQHRDVIAGAAELLGSIAAAAPSTLDKREACDGLQAGQPPLSRRWYDILILDAAGIVRCSTQPGTVGGDRSAMPEVVQAMARESMARRTLEANSFAADPTLPMALHWRGADGKRGVALLVLRPGPAVIPLIQATLPASASALIVDRGGRILYAVPGLTFPRGRGPGAVGVPPTLTELLPQVRVGAETGIWFDGSQRVLAWDALDPNGMPGVRVLVGIDTAATRADLDRAATLMIWGIAATLFAATLLAFWGGVHFIRTPLGVLRRAAMRWRDGDRTARVRLRGQSEIAALGRVFDEMAEATEGSERRIREGAELLNALIESSADGIFVIDREGRFLLVNSTFARLIGKPRADLAGQRAEDVLAPDMIVGFRDVAQRVLQTGGPSAADLVLPREGSAAQPEASQRVLQTIFAPIMAPDSPGSPVAVAGIARDVTAERDAEAELRAAKDRAETADQSKTRFLAAASHDLRQPLQAAILFASLIAQQGEAGTRKTADQLRQVLDDLRAMLDSLFDVSRYDAQVVQPDINPLRLQPLLEQIVAAAGGGARAKGITLIARPTDAWVMSDRALLGRMISNIVENAVRYTDMGSVTIACVPNGGHLRIEVRDTGRGIAQDDLNRIWQEFEQLHNPERDRRQGLGLGLAIVRRLSRLLGHPVTVSSTVGAGSSFVIEVPLAPAPAQVEAAAPEPHVAAPQRPHAGGGTAILIEDDAALLGVLGMILEEQGWTVLGAGDDAELLPKISPTRTDARVILTDYRLRGGRLGSDAIAAIRARIGRDVPAIILTGEIADDSAGTDGPQRDASRLGNVFVLRKPVGAKDLVAAVSRVASQVDA